MPRLEWVVRPIRSCRWLPLLFPLLILPFLCGCCGRPVRYQPNPDLSQGLDELRRNGGLADCATRVGSDPRQGAVWQGTYTFTDPGGRTFLLAITYSCGPESDPCRDCGCRRFHYFYLEHGMPLGGGLGTFDRAAGFIQLNHSESDWFQQMGGAPASLRLVPYRWGRRHYLIPANLVAEFRGDIASGRERSGEPSPRWYLKVEDLWACGFGPPRRLTIGPADDPTKSCVQGKSPPRWWR